MTKQGIPTKVKPTAVGKVESANIANARLAAKAATERQSYRSILARKTSL